ncbi:BatA domain-containing protein [Pontibacter fetidus]|uniref:Aerotolerance regulator N-terminal domain-containing protein n=1 Tax=Pontibacter fetidus TaxID=2700082 RepID=A0A6B2H0Y8_9BACT|nr:BatA domain-containing protein [Pontibacter fetidus]NDK56765.1 hypothetical protein [Pontibacter fetidus]
MAFLHPLFLFALTAIVIPIILHLVQLRRAKRIEFSNVRFIKASQEVTANQRKIKELLILICRILAVIFLVLAFAQPFLPGTSSATSSEKDVTIMLDNSYSMQNVQADKDVSLLTFAVDKAKQIFDFFPPASVFSIVQNSNVSNTRFPSASDARAALDNVAFSSIPTNTLSASVSGHTFLLSDFQRTSFKPSLLNKISSTTQVHLIPLQPENTANIYIDTVYLEDAFIRPGGESTLHVKLYNTGKDAVDDLPLKLIIKEEQVAALSIDIPASKGMEAIINFRVPGNQAVPAYITIDDYPVEFDNTYYFILKPSRELKVIEVNDGKTLGLESLFTKESFFKITSYTSGAVNYARLNDADLVILNGLTEASAALATTLSNYIKTGGTVFISPPIAGDAISYSSLFNSIGINARLTNASASKTDLLVPAADNPFFKGIFADYDRKMQMPSASRSLSWSRASEDILKYRGGASFLSRFDKGAGKVYLMSAPLHEDYNTLVNHALLLPVMYKVALSGYKQEQQLAYTLSASTIKLPEAKTAKGEGIYKLEKDSLSFIPEQQLRGGSLFVTMPADLNEAGIYALTLDGETAGTIAFNYDNRESVLDQYTPDELRSMVGPDKKNIHVYDYGDALSVKNEFEKRYFGVKLWKYCLILCLFFLMAEIALIRLL